MRPETLAVHAGGEPDAATGAMSPPLHLATTFAHGPAGERVAGYEYTREGNPTQDRFETALAGFLSTHPGIEAVHYPGLASHPNPAVAAKQMRDFGGMMSFQVRGGREAALAFAGRLQLITNATSLGGCESLIEHRASVEGPRPFSPQNLLRFSVGLENLEDLREDLRQALA
jgi:cystathionine beta-lyase/cystathionine gamma-synthase